MADSAEIVAPAAEGPEETTASGELHDDAGSRLGFYPRRITAQRLVYRPWNTSCILSTLVRWLSCVKLPCDILRACSVMILFCSAALRHFSAHLPLSLTCPLRPVQVDKMTAPLLRRKTASRFPTSRHGMPLHRPWRMKFLQVGSGVYTRFSRRLSPPPKHLVVPRSTRTHENAASEGLIFPPLHLDSLSSRCLAVLEPWASTCVQMFAMMTLRGIRDVNLTRLMKGRTLWKTEQRNMP